MEEHCKAKPNHDSCWVLEDASKQRQTDDKVVMVTGPCCKQESDHGAISVEAEKCNTIELESESRQEAGVMSWVAPESFFGAREKEAVMQEMEDRSSGERVTHIVPSAGAKEVAGFDACGEYGYSYAYYDEEDAADVQEKRVDPSLLNLDVTTVSFGNLMTESIEEDAPAYPLYVLGKVYDPHDDYTLKRNDENSLFWFTYRKDFPEIVPYRITTDAGWGCMLRSAQMLLGHTLRMHYKDRDWRPPQAVAQKRRDAFLCNLLTWFADFPSQNECFFSLHNMVAAGLAKYEILPGEWYGPGTACHVIRDLCELFDAQQAKGTLSKSLRGIFRVHVAAQGTVYRDEVENLLTRDARKESAEIEAIVREYETPLTHPLDPRYDLKDDGSEYDWETSLLLLIPLRLGLKTFNDQYSTVLANVFGLKQSVGVLGGRPRGARWFYGASSDGQKLFGLDPHTIQGAPQRRTVTTSNGSTKQVIAFTEHFLRSIQTTDPEVMELKRVDPSLALGFYCADRKDFDDLCTALQKFQKENPECPDLCSFADSVPDYSANVSSVMTDMMSMSIGGTDTGALTEPGAQDGDDEGSEEDEFVLL
mmetsp:Transcript_23399/g.54351  ORF Transcript_23399/g.54351 Transcript_23399/m.54351 type:complete len:590 (-) Transcript_23399:1147-2916(-)